MSTHECKLIIHTKNKYLPNRTSEQRAHLDFIRSENKLVWFDESLRVKEQFYLTNKDIDPERYIRIIDGNKTIMIEPYDQTDEAKDKFDSLVEKLRQPRSNTEPDPGMNTGFNVGDALSAIHQKKGGYRKKRSKRSKKRSKRTKRTKRTKKQSKRTKRTKKTKRARRSRRSRRSRR